MVTRTSSVILLVAGIGVFVFGSYMSREASQGEEKISEAQEEAAGQRKPLLGPVRKSVRAHQAETAQKKIGNAKENVAESRITAKWLQGSGILLVIVGLGCIASKSSRKKRD